METTRKRASIISFRIAMNDTASYRARENIFETRWNVCTDFSIAFAVFSLKQRIQH